MIAIRRAAPGEAASLTELALRSKAHWGYDAAFVEACRPALTVHAEDEAYVLEEAGAARGFYALRPLGEDVDLALFFVEPAAIGTGLGRRLWEHAVATARGHRLLIESEPCAEGFYLKMGAVRIGEAPGVGRQLPLLAFVL